jgi:hypothetical protein
VKKQEKKKIISDKKDPPCVEKTMKKRKSYQIQFFGSGPLIGAVTTI